MKRRSFFKSLLGILAGSSVSLPAIQKEREIIIPARIPDVFSLLPPVKDSGKYFQFWKSEPYTPKSN